MQGLQFLYISESQSSQIRPNLCSNKPGETVSYKHFQCGGTTHFANLVSSTAQHYVIQCFQDGPLLKLSLITITKAAPVTNALLT